MFREWGYYVWLYFLLFSFYEDEFDSRREVMREILLRVVEVNFRIL